MSGATASDSPKTSTHLHDLLKPKGWVYRCHRHPNNLPKTNGNWPEKSYPSSWRVVPQLQILQRGRDFLAIRSSCPWPVPTWPAGCRCLCRQAWPVSQSLHDLLWQQDSPYPFGQKKAKNFIKVIIFCNLFGVVWFRFFTLHSLFILNRATSVQFGQSPIKVL